MNAWARNRKRIILAIVIFAVLILVGVPAAFLFRKAPSCFDGVKNGDEAGVDCGGSCQKLCEAASLPLVIHGDPRILKVSSSTYEVVAVVENPNQSAIVSHAGFTLTLYGGDSLVPVKTITNTAYVPAAGTFAIFEGPFVAQGIPTRATLTWQEPLAWEKVTILPPQLSVQQSPFDRLATSPRLIVQVVNPALRDVSNVDLTALVYDADGTVFAASKTFVNTIPASSMAQAIFTWPVPFTKTPVKVDVLTRILPDQTYLR